MEGRFISFDRSQSMPSLEIQRIQDLHDGVTFGESDGLRPSVRLSLVKRFGAPQHRLFACQNRLSFKVLHWAWTPLFRHFRMMIHLQRGLHVALPLLDVPTLGANGGEFPVVFLWISQGGAQPHAGVFPRRCPRNEEDQADFPFGGQRVPIVLRDGAAQWLSSWFSPGAETLMPADPACSGASRACDALSRAGTRGYRLAVVARYAHIQSSSESGKLSNMNTSALRST